MVWDYPTPPYQYSQENKLLRDSVFNITKASQFSLLQTQYGIVEKERANETLKTKLAFKAQQNIYLIIGVALAGIVGLLGFLLARQRKKNNTKLEETVRLRTKDLQIANQELKEFAYITSHDMREPIRSIHSFSKLADKKISEGNTADIRDYLSIISKSSIQLNNLVKDVYSFIRIDESVLEKTEFDFHNALNDVTTDLALQIKEKAAQIDFGPAIVISTNFSLLKIILKNLIENAIKYNESEPVIINIDGQEPDQYYHFTITDNGIGIDEEYREYIFRMFKRLHHRGSYPGSGLGLPICKKIVQRLGGEIEFAGEGIDGQGASFKFSIQK